MCFLLFVQSAHPQKAAVLSPDNTPQSQQYAGLVNENLSRLVKTADLDLAATVLRAQAPERPFNQTVAEARALGTGIGSEYLILLRADTIRRTSLEKDKYFEAYAVYFVVSSKTGMLVHWGIQSHEADEPEPAGAQLLDSIPGTAAEIADRIKADQETGGAVPVDESVAELLPDSDPTARYPLPYRRIKPPYTNTAKLYRVEATVDIEVEIDAEGKVAHTRIVRWAGYGLEESVENTVRSMNWRPADSRGKSFAMRVLLRYNFEDLENQVD
jgi:hypothetical protein